MIKTIFIWGVFLSISFEVSSALAEANPLLRPSSLDQETYEWDKIKVEHYLPALKATMAEAKENIDKIVENKEEPTFENTLAALEFASSRYEYVASAYFGLQSLLQDQLEPISSEVQKLTDQFSAELAVDQRIFERVKALYEKKDQLDLDVDQERLLIGSYEAFVRNGVNLSQDVLKQVKEIKARIGELQVSYGRNTTKSLESFEYLVTDEKKLAGFSDRLKSHLRQLAKSKNKEGWLLTLAPGDYSEVIKTAEDSELRKKIYMARKSVAYKNGPMGEPEGAKFDNRSALLEIVQLRHKKAQLLGFKNHAELVLQDKMAETPEKVKSFLGELIGPIKAAATKEYETLKVYKKKKTGNNEPINKWDFGYWQTQYKKDNLGVDQEEIRQYFLLENVLKKGVMKLGKTFWDLDFVERKDLPKYHPDAFVYEVKENGQTRGIVYFDLFARSGKRGGAWMMPLRGQHLNQEGQNVSTLIMVSTNISKPEEGKPVLLSMREVETLFHEMGHAFHMLLSDVRYASQSGSSVAWDFVEVPSQVPENFVIQEDVLKLFARHHETGETIPQKLIDQVVADRQAFTASFELGQSIFEFIDLAWYTTTELPSVEGIGEFEAAARAKAELEPSKEDISISSSFGHIFTGGYHAGYYGYKWARVIGTDLWSAFEENGGFTLEKSIPIAQKLRETVLSKGDTKHPTDLFIDFRGREPKTDFFLKNLERQSHSLMP